MQNLNNKKKYKIAIVAPVPFYYHVPLYQKLAESSAIDLTVYYCSDETIHGIDVEKTYNTKGNFCKNGDLLLGYKSKFLKNYSFRPSYLHWPDGLINFGVWQEIKNARYDAVVLQSWTNLSWWLAFIACLIYKTPVLFMTDSNISSEASKSGFKKFIKTVLLQYFLFNNAKGFLTSGLSNEEFYKFYGVSESKMSRLYFSWGYEKILLKTKELKLKREEIRKSLNVDKDDIVILYVGRLAKEKNPDILLNAFSKINKKNVKLFFVGDGPLRKEIEQKIKNLRTKNVSILGFQSRDNVLIFYALADILVLPSNAETWGIVVNEAMCFGLPVILSDKVGAGADMVKDNCNGFIFESKNVNSLTDKLEEFLSLPQEKASLFSKRSKEIIEDWVNKIDPVIQIKNILNK
jgi:glycosyltransferase involved in cell wall biosynthesis